MRFFSLNRYRALVQKEFRQLQRNKRLIIQLTIPPTIMLVLWGYALNPEVRNMPLGLVDEDRTPASRAFLDSLTQLEAFETVGFYLTERDLEDAFEKRRVEAGVIVPPGYAERLASGQVAQVQVIFDAVKANSAAVAGGYIQRIAADVNRGLLRRTAFVSPTASGALPGPSEIHAIPVFNPGMIFAWYYVTAVMAVVLFVDGSLVAAAIGVREKEVGTIEQLLMSPAQSLEILLAKTTPVLTLLVVGLLASTVTGMIVFDLPLRGSLLLYVLNGFLAGFAAMGLGMLLATFSRTQQQAQFLTFFINPFIMLFSGAFARLENLPQWAQWLSLLDPLRYLVEVIRGVTIRGAGIEYLWRPLGSLLLVTALVYAWSAWRFRRQLN